MAESYRPYLLEIRGVLSISDFHIGSGSKLSIATDAPLLIDFEDQPFVPGSSLKGVLRSHLEREAPLLVTAWEQVCESLFGKTPKKKEDFRPFAGRLRVFDSCVIRETECGTGDVRHHREIRDHVKIDCRYGAAERGAKFDQEVAGPAKLAFHLVYEGDSAKDNELMLLQEAVRVLEAGELSCGAKGGLGYGQLKLLDTQYAVFDRTKPEDLAAWLEARRIQEMTFERQFQWPEWQQGGKLHHEATVPKFEPYSRLRLELIINFEGPVLVRAPIPPTGHPTRVLDAKKKEDYQEKGLLTADRAFVQTGPDNAYYLPAASLRGVLRHQAERIAKVAKGTEGKPPELFGEIHGESGRKGLIEVDIGTLVDPANPVYLDHVAIDRLTGFAADSRKFATCALQSPSFKTSMRVRFQRRHLASVALAGFVLRDLLDGILWCGGGTSRGYGYIKSGVVTESTLDWTPGEEVPSEFLPGANRESPPGRTKITTSGAIPFDSWFWLQAETAWVEALQAPGGKEQSK